MCYNTFRLREINLMLIVDKNAIPYNERLTALYGIALKMEDILW